MRPHTKLKARDSEPCTGTEPMMPMPLMPTLRPEPRLETSESQCVRPPAPAVMRCFGASSTRLDTRSRPNWISTSISLSTSSRKLMSSLAAPDASTMRSVGRMPMSSERSKAVTVCPAPTASTLASFSTSTCDAVRRSMYVAITRCTWYGTGRKSPPCRRSFTITSVPPTSGTASTEPPLPRRSVLERRTRDSSMMPTCSSACRNLRTKRGLPLVMLNTSVSSRDGTCARPSVTLMSVLVSSFDIDCSSQYSVLSIPISAKYDLGTGRNLGWNLVKWSGRVKMTRKQRTETLESR
mmetsp:Transcript_5235/g.18824  ORF Transcript_5235/g.18824 Transcript_5235/m.18824 type:complete len:295 (-) Transcript_5235:893-1777(-)